jgi:hypothetical protein
MKVRKPKDITKLFREGTEIDKALQEAARDARRLHKQMGVPLVVWQNGRTVLIPPEKIVVDERVPKPRRRRR